jgi:hypothetical protein
MALHKFATKINIQTLISNAVCSIALCLLPSVVQHRQCGLRGRRSDVEGARQRLETGGRSRMQSPQVGGGQAGKGHQRWAEAGACCRTAVRGPRWRRSPMDGGAKDGERRSSCRAPGGRERRSGGLYHGGGRWVGRVESLTLVD